VLADVRSGETPVNEEVSTDLRQLLDDCRAVVERSKRKIEDARAAVVRAQVQLTRARVVLNAERAAETGRDATGVFKQKSEMR
jgi:hypothetical protein